VETPAEGNSFSWFDIVILESPNHTEPRIEDGISLVWLSHANRTNAITRDIIQGKLFSVEKGGADLRNLISFLKVTLLETKLITFHRDVFDLSPVTQSQSECVLSLLDGKILQILVNCQSKFQIKVSLRVLNRV
jgi:hypothetical protein